MLMFDISLQLPQAATKRLCKPRRKTLTKAYLVVVHLMLRHRNYNFTDDGRRLLTIIPVEMQRISFVLEPQSVLAGIKCFMAFRPSINADLYLLQNFERRQDL